MIMPEPLTADAFAPFGAVFQVPATVGTRDYFDAPLENLRPGAVPSLSVILAAPVTAGPLTATMMERHAFSSQSFVPMAPARWVVLVASDAPDGGPHMAAARAFLPAPGQGLTLKPGAWHFPLTVLETPAPFALLMWRDGGPDDCEVRDVAAVTVAL